MVRLAHADSLYERIAAEILRRVASGELRPGDRLPPIRQAAGEWGVNLNTVARAYAARAERLQARLGSAILEALAAGYGDAEIEAAVSVQLARWRAVRVSDPRAGTADAEAGPEQAEDLLRLVGSHDLALDVLAGR